MDINQSPWEKGDSVDEHTNPSLWGKCREHLIVVSEALVVLGVCWCVRVKTSTITVDLRRRMVAMSWCTACSTQSTVLIHARKLHCRSRTS